jgi:preprotein translocase subunit SecA
MVNWMFHIQVQRQPPPPPPRPIIQPVQADGAGQDGAGAPVRVNGTNGAARPAGPAGMKKSAGRNDPCPCGSGKKYKFCCLKTGAA